MLLAPSMSTLHHYSVSQFYATHVCSSEVQVILTNNEAYYKCIRLNLDYLIVYKIISQQAHFTTEIRNILTVCSAYHSESTFLSYSSRKFQCPLFDSVGYSCGRAQMCSRVLLMAFHCSFPLPPL